MLRLVLFCAIFLIVPLHCTSHSVLTLENESDRSNPALEKGWNQWGEWKPCSRSCGGGITHMLRHCKHTRIDGSPDCVGPNRKYSSCNVQDCPEGSTDFRGDQCSLFNNQSYRGRLYRWKPYVSAPALNPCELHCQSENGSFITKFADKVMDGTRCSQNSNDVCVDGTCQEVGCDKMLGSSFKNDKCMECGGFGSTCYRVHGVFNVPNPPAGYIGVVTIPIGATSIEIDEHKATRNHLAVRNSRGDFVLNGNLTLNRSLALQVAGTTLNYRRRLSRRRASESLLANGPTTEIFYVDLAVHEKNRGIRYNFYLPIGTNDPNNENIEWVAGEWSQCTRDCGGGTQSRQLTCHKDGVEVSSYVCKLVQRPQRRQECNLEPCRARWRSSDWMDCSASCGGGIKLRHVFCTETPMLSTSFPRLIPDRRCDDEDNSLRPPTHGICNEHPCPRWLISNWTECSSTCGAGLQQRQVTCASELSCSSISTPKSIQECNLGPCTGIEWVVTSWSSCTEKCGTGIQTRQVRCVSEDGVKYGDRICQDLPRPSSQRSCHSRSECTDALRWMAGDWSECSADCSTGLQTRKVVCSHIRAATYRTFPDNLCEGHGEKPATSRNCSNSECRAKWFTGSWKSCSLSCGGGRRTRHVICPVQTTDLVLNELTCDMRTKPAEEESCNVEACPRQGRQEVSNIVDSENPAYIECSLTLYGCCLDNRTPAQDWLMTGCENVNPITTPPSACHSSRFGCCRDGIRTSTGPDQYGCPEYDVCFVASDLGQLCGERWIARYYYNSETSTCNFFWYGGCGGNRNNHVSMERCLEVCATKDTDSRGGSNSRSSSSVSRGTLTTSVPTQGYTSPVTTAPTASIRRPTTTFVLQTAEPVPNTVSIPTSTSTLRSTQTLLLPVLAKSTESLWVGRPLVDQVCSLPPSRGRCLRTVRRWYFDWLEKRCKRFLFGGCAPNSNNFITRAECQSMCGNRKQQLGTTTANSIVQTECQLKRLRAQAEGKQPLQCEESNGKYRLLQCISGYSAITSWCWCVDPDSGNEIDGTRRYGSITPNCQEWSKPPTSRSQSCAVSRYGCCPDGVTLARGYKRTGCKESVHIRSSRTVVTVKKGGSARLSCSAYGRPKPLVRWYKDGQEITGSSRARLSVSVDYSRHFLIFTSVQPQDVGSYVCEASNGVGQPQRRTLRLSWMVEKLQFRARPANVTASEGQVVLLKCRVRGRRVSIAWFKNGKPQRTDNYVTVSPLGDLRITQSLTSDSGKYTCSASDAEDEISASAYVTVYSGRTTAEQCIDQHDLANCTLVAKANMCQERIYEQEICCLTCRSHKRRIAPHSRRRISIRL